MEGRNISPKVHSAVTSKSRAQERNAWPVARLGQATTTATYRDNATGEWTAARTQLHEAIIGRILDGISPSEHPKIVVVTGGVGSGKTTLINSELVAKYPHVAIIDADRLWLEIPEYEELASADWADAANRTYSEVSCLRDAALAEAAARRLDIILETPGDEHLNAVLDQLIADGYEASISCVDCPVEEARRRIEQRAANNPTPEDNLWTSPPQPDFPDKYNYQNVNSDIFRNEYAKRKQRIHARPG